MNKSNRKNWVDMLIKVIDPVLQSFCNEELHKKLSTNPETEGRRHCTGLEMLGRTLAGAAPWLETPAVDNSEEELRQKYASMARKAITVAVDPESPDYCVFGKNQKMFCEQWLVDAAFLALALVRAPHELVDLLPEKSRQQLVDAFMLTRNIRACFNNWVIFSAMVEAGLYKLGADYDMTRVDFAVRQTEQWYIGDGHYKDGPNFRFDYYNSFIIHPMYATLIDVFNKDYTEYPRDENGKNCLQRNSISRMKRYSRTQELLISPDGSFPAFGRSITYRCGAFHALALTALWEELPSEVSPAAARCALYKVISKTLGAENTFDEDGWLRIGLCGHQPSLGEFYISTGSLYLCTQAFLPLGLPADKRFWTDEDELTSWEKLYSGINLNTDHSKD